MISQIVWGAFSLYAPARASKGGTRADHLQDSGMKIPPEQEEGDHQSLNRLAPPPEELQHGDTMGTIHPYRIPGDSYIQPTEWWALGQFLPPDQATSASNELEDDMHRMTGGRRHLAYVPVSTKLVHGTAVPAMLRDLPVKKRDPLRPGEGGKDNNHHCSYHWSSDDPLKL